MSRKKTSRQEPPTVVHRKPSRKLIVAIGIALSLLAGGAALALRSDSVPQTQGKENTGDASRICAR
ncbi:MAG: hypothetical protein AABO41_22170 [Acidobacteriota bacterium]